MRFRDLVIIAFISSLTVGLGLRGKAILDHLLYDSRAINRDDARSVTSTRIPRERWSEFHILGEATTVRLLTNAALKSTDAPDHDLTNPRQGWRYTIEYELLDSQGNVVDAAEYHFRSQIRQLKDVSTGESIYPIFLGKSGLVSAQTRPMQLAIDHFPQRPTILRVRLKSADPGIVEVVGRCLSRIERADYNKRYTWNRLSKMRRDLICKYTVYQPELLTHDERTNLLRWRWTQTPALSDSQNQSLFFIGSFDDQEIRDEQLPAGLFTDPNWLATLPIPEGRGRLRLEFINIDAVDSGENLVAVNWYGIGATDRQSFKHRLTPTTSELAIDVEGGLIQIESPCRLISRAYWASLDSSPNAAEGETEITPLPILSKAFVADQQPLEYQIEHLGDEPTPLRLALRYPYGPHFKNLVISSSDDPAAANLGVVSTTWEFLDAKRNVVDSGELNFAPVVSKYDNLELVAGTEWLSDPEYYYFSIPPGVRRLRIRSPQCRMLVTAAARPGSLSRTTQIPEDYFAFARATSLSRTWFSLNPPNDHELVQANRTIILRLRPRPPEDNPVIVAGDYQWRRFLPGGQWIGRQMLVPRQTEVNVREQSPAVVFFQLEDSHRYLFRPIAESRSVLPTKLIVVGDDAPGQVSLIVDGDTLVTKQLRSARGELDLSDTSFPQSGSIEIRSEVPARYFIAGRYVESTPQYLKRTAQRLGSEPLVFPIVKRSFDEELLTIQVYRKQRGTQRYRMRVVIQPEGHAQQTATPARTWTAMDRTYDLRPHTDLSSLVLGDDAHVDVGHRCFVRLGEELPPGSYRIRLQGEDVGKEVYVLMYQTISNQSAKRTVRVNKIPRVEDGA